MFLSKVKIIEGGVSKCKEMTYTMETVTHSHRVACFKIALYLGSLNTFPKFISIVSSCVTSHQSSHSKLISTIVLIPSKIYVY